jgi:fibro-slime domain-containing protein
MKPKSTFALLVCAAAVLALGLAAMIGPRRSRATEPAEADALPSVMHLNAVIRDFKAKGEAGGHPDFQSFSGSGRYGLVADHLDGEGKPVTADIRGRQAVSEFKDAAGRPIAPNLYDASRGDVAGTLAAGDSSNGFTSESSFSQWYREAPGVNVSTNVDLAFHRISGTNRYVFDSATDEPYKSMGGFFPINGQLLGNYSTTGKNFHFTTELTSRFVYERNSGQVFTFTGDDDVWVFIDGRLVIDLGGLHSRKSQTLELNRLTWLEDGRTYQLKIFHAERRTNESNFRIETNLKLAPAELPPVADPFD